VKSFFIWLQRDEGWKAMLAFIYAVICVFDFIIVPSWIGINRSDIELGLNLTQIAILDPAVQMKMIDAMTFQHDPFTLKNGGLFHIAFGALLTGSAINRIKTTKGE
jgi:hypothetical protein